MISALDISTSALVAERIRMDTISSNIANISTMRQEDGRAEPFQARHVIFQTDEHTRTSQGAVGVKVSEVETKTIEPLYKFQPTHPLAIQDGPRKGYVAYPNINLTEQFVDALSATRAYEANIGVMEISKSMSERTLSILA